MAVNKELLAKYKDLKAQGVNVTLAELKAQMEQDNSEQNTNVEQTIVKTGFGALNNSANTINEVTTPQTAYNSYTQPVTLHVPPQMSYNAIQSNQYSAEVKQNEYTGNIDYTKIPQQLEVQAKKFALIGYPLGHSLSTYIHSAGFKSIDIDATYEILETPPEELSSRIKYLKNNGYSGFNITIPHKVSTILFIDELDASADIVGAINTVVINSDKTLKGYNTDVIGFKRAIPHDIDLVGKTVGILGTGGAARAAIAAFATSNVKKINLYTRNIPNCSKLLSELRKNFINIDFNAFQIERIRDLSELDILVNTTPIGMYGKTYGMSPVEEPELKTLPPHSLVYDVIYNPKKSALINLAIKNGYRTINGVDMFVNQAIVAEEIWLGKTPDFKDMKIAVLENL